ncbi:MAG: nuclear transport factor 2 family protein [Pyrinomonadaceae bacterium]
MKAATQITVGPIIGITISAPEMREMKNTKYSFSDIKIHLAGQTAWATFKYTISADVTNNGQQRHVDSSGLGTAILENRDGRWRIVHWHSSAPRRAPSNPAPPKN